MGIEMVNEKWKKAVAVLIGCVVLAAISITVYSKYYKTSYEKGMAIASGFYFSSNYMYEEDGLSGIEDIESLKKETELVSRLMVAVSNEPWTSSSFQFDVEVRNHTNQLLYNDKDLDVAYTVEFILLDPPAGADYSIGKAVNGVVADNRFVPLNSASGDLTKATFQGTLEGGKLSWESYVLRVDLNNSQGQEYIPSRVLMMAYPVEPSYLENTKKIAGIIKAEYNLAEMEITDQKFTIENELEEADDWKARAKEESAFVYQLKTTGNYYVDGNDNMLQKIRIEWDPDMFALNENDRYLNHAEGTRLVEYDEEKGIMVIETAPYSSIKFIFFKRYRDDGQHIEGFDDKIDRMQSLDELKGTVKAVKVDN